MGFFDDCYHIFSSGGAVLSPARVRVCGLTSSICWWYGYRHTLEIKNQKKFFPRKKIFFWIKNYILNRFTGIHWVYLSVSHTFYQPRHRFGWFLAQIWVFGSDYCSTVRTEEHTRSFIRVPLENTQVPGCNDVKKDSKPSGMNQWGSLMTVITFLSVGVQIWVPWGSA